MTIPFSPIIDEAMEKGGSETRPKDAAPSPRPAPDALPAESEHGENAAARNNNCRRRFWWRSCRFEPRYNRCAPAAEAIAAIRSLSKSEFLLDLDVAALRQMGARAYVHDICVRCGRIVSLATEGHKSQSLQVESAAPSQTDDGA